MKIATLNYTGNCGKTTIVKNLLAPNIEGAVITAIESINSGNESDTTYKAEKTNDAVIDLIINENSLFDVGSSNIEVFLSKIQEMEGGLELFDLFVVPVVAEEKQIKDTISTIQALSALGISSDKIRLVFNRVSLTEDLKEAFSIIFKYHEKYGTFTLNPEAAVPEASVYSMLSKESLYAVAADDEDYMALIAQTDDKKEKVRLAKKLQIRGLAKKAVTSLTSAFEAVVA